ncbi:excitatory amino acid transporter 3-like [Stegastes partitus]|uniref:Amino acid transporter n=1 Tax=Stegastes partitus TaxID=144197 RepID=A0A9Y4TPJ9_9TELE|nr:PREDICTED: excitatory amino acid transporter 3-like [Stegastes partitus]
MSDTVRSRITLGSLLNRHATVTRLAKDLIAIPAQLLMQMLQVVSIPITVTSMIIGVNGFRLNSIPKIAARGVVYFAVTTLLAVATGMTLVLLIKPGLDGNSGTSEDDTVLASYTAQALIDVIRWRLHQKLGDGGEGKLLLRVAVAVNSVMGEALTWIQCYLPVGILFMITGNLVEVYDWETVSKLGGFIAVVITGLAIHGGIVLPGLYFLMTRRSPWPVIKGAFHALLTSLCISSSSGTMPITMQCCRTRMNIDDRITRFMMPIGTSGNMDGTALYETVAAVFIANLNGTYLDFAQLLTIVVMAGICSLTAEALPATGAVSTLFVLNSVGLPVKQASILLAVEWLL